SAFHAIFRTDLKSILAYSTVAALGMLVFLIGIGTSESLLAASVFTLVHALYKASLFLTAGVIDHETGTRDITQLSGLRKVLLPLAIGGLLAALSSAGIPLTFGFIGKDLIYEATLHTAGILTVVLTAVAVLTNVLLLCAGFLAGIKPFTGALPERYGHVHLPHGLMWGAPLLLGLLGVVFGCAPALVDTALLNPAAEAMHGSRIDTPLKLWHGFNLVLLLSGITLAVGTVLYLLRRPSAATLASIERYNALSPKHLIGQLARFARAVAIRFTRTLHNGYLR